jgi:hypothetical protein
MISYPFLNIHTISFKLINDNFYCKSLQNWNNASNSRIISIFLVTKTFVGSQTINRLQSSSYKPWNQKSITRLHKIGKIKHLLIFLKAPVLLGGTRQNQGRGPIQSPSLTASTVSNNRWTYSSTMHHMVNLSSRRFSSTKAISIYNNMK